ncbi:ParA family protein [Ornithinimicrobium faecis]|uniref:ParA family protein n=1 Tax=Ornithinimicrobium faecis TaxID=2934158 RepID=UPI0022B752E8|nr:ParA family protein [Ornithinimicrobium sp. HY1745]
MKTLTLKKPHSLVGWPQPATSTGVAVIREAGGKLSSPLGWPSKHVSRETDPTDTRADALDARETATPDETEVRDDLSETSVSRETAGVASSDAPRAVAAAHTTDLPRPREPRVLTVANQKGGVGKTTTAVNMAAALSQSGLRVLVIDMDPQGNASTALGIDHGGDVAGIYDVLIDGAPLEDVVQESPSLPGLLCAPATIDLAGAEIELVPMVARESRLRKAVATFLAARKAAGSPVDYVFIDCPPSLGLLTINSFVAGSEVLIPIQCEYYALEGLSQLLTNIELIKEHLNPTLTVSHILLTMYDGRTRLSSQVADEVRSHFASTVLRTSIPRSVRISEAPSHGETVITYDPVSSGALCYLEAAKEVARAAQSKGAQTNQEGSDQ